MRILLGVPSGGSPSLPFVESLAQLQFPESMTSFDRFVVTGNFVPAQRELVVARALAVNADVLVMCDDDMILPPDAIVSLIDVLAADPRCGVAGALYYSRDGFRPMVVDAWDPQDTTTASIPAFAREPVAVGGIGFGCVVIRMDAVRELPPLYFPAHVYVEPQAARVRVCDEDYLFCHRLAAHGWRTMLHPAVRCGHFDRSTGKVMPETWETHAQTNYRRMAVWANGGHALVPAYDAPSHGEYHQRPDIEYVSPRL